MNYGYTVYKDELQHHGIIGQKWGVRRFQNSDGSYKKGAEGRYNSDEDSEKDNKESEEEKAAKREKAKKVAKGVAIGTAITAAVIASAVGAYMVKDAIDTEDRNKMVNGVDAAQLKVMGLINENGTVDDRQLREYQKLKKQARKNRKTVNKIRKEIYNKNLKRERATRAEYASKQKLYTDAAKKAAIEEEKYIKYNNKAHTSANRLEVNTYTRLAKEAARRQRIFEEASYGVGIL